MVFWTSKFKELTSCSGITGQKVAMNFLQITLLEWLNEKLSWDILKSMIDADYYFESDHLRIERDYL